LRCESSVSRISPKLRWTSLTERRTSRTSAMARDAMRRAESGSGSAI
jgi:hypothetical protein